MDKLFTRLVAGLLLLLAPLSAYPGSGNSLNLKNGDAEGLFSIETDVHSHVRPAPAVMDLTVSIPDVSVQPGDQFCLGLSVSGFDNILGMQFSLAYDPDLLTFDAIQNINLDGLNLSTIGTPPDETAPGQISVSWLDPSLAGLSLADGTVIFEVCFTATNTDATATLDFGSTPTLIEVVDGDENNVNFTGESSTITVGDGGSGGGNSDFTVTISDETVDAGDSFCVDVSVDGFTNILGMQFSISYDPDELTFDAIQNIDLDGLNLSTIGTPPDETMPGRISVSWLDPDLQGLDLADGAVIFQICFTAGSDNATTTIDFANTPTLIEVTDGDENDVTFNGAPGTVTIQNGNTGGGNPGELTISVSDATVASGDQACVDVSVTDFTNILGLQFSLSYDPSLLEFSEIQGINLDGLNLSTIGTPPDETNPGQISVSWLDPALAGLDLADGTVIFQVCFNAIGNDGSMATIDFSNTPTLIEVVDGDENDVDFNGESGNVTISGGGGGNPDGFTVTLSDETVSQGEQMCVEVSVDNFTNILGLQFSLAYDPSRLEFVAIQNINLDGLDLSTIGTPPDETDPGQISMSWLDPGLAGLDLPDGTVIFEVCFDAIGNDGTTTIGFSNTPTLIEVIDGDEEEVNFNGDPSTVTINTIIPPDGFTVAVSDASVESGEQFCVDVSVFNFDNILGLQFSLNYDQNELEFDGIQNINLDGLNLSTIGTPPDETSPGQISMSWLDPAVTGLDVPDGTVIFEVCFTASGDNSTSSISFSSTPTLIEVVDGNEDPVDFNGQSGTVTIGSGNGGGGPTYDEFTIVLPDVDIESGEQFCMDVEVYNFMDIVGMQFSLSYDPSLLEFVSVGNFNLDGLNMAQFGVPGNGSIVDGQVTLVWVEPALEPVDLPDGTAIFEICFEAIGPNGTTTPVEVTGSPTPIEVNNSSDEAITVDVDNAVVNISTITAPAPAADITDVDCFGEETGAIALTVTGGTGNYTFSWTGPDNFSSDQEDISGLAEGAYFVTISDTDSGLETQTDFIVGGPNSAVAILNTSIDEASCDGAADGSITVFGSGGTAPLTYSWDNGLPNGAIQNGLSAGTYTVTVTDDNGCTVVSDPLVVEAADDVIDISADAQDVSCFEGNDGSLTLSISGGTPNYTIDWASLPDGDDAPSGLSAGSYDVTVTDANGCTESETLTVEGPEAPITITNDQVTDVTCFGGNDGALQINISGGTPGYDINWQAPLPDQQLAQGALQAGDYTVTVTDGNDCVETQTVTISGPPSAISVDEQITEVLCFGDGDGAISLSVSGGGGGFGYNWANPLPDGTPFQSNLDPGEYSVTITDNFNCQETRSFVVPGPTEPLALTTQTQDVLCSGESSGAIMLTVSGGTPDYDYDWSGDLPDDQPNQSQLAAATYTVTVTDGNSCTEVREIEVAEPMPISVAADVTDIEMGGDGAIELEVSGGSVGDDYQYSWSGPAMFSSQEADLANLAEPGEYCVTITDDNGCTFEFCANLLEKLRFGQIQVTPACPGENNGEITVEIIGGTPPIEIEWFDSDNVFLSDGATLTGVPGGTYNIVVSDATGDDLNGSFEITILPELMVDASITDVFGDLGAETGAISLSFSGSDPNPVVVWDHNDTGAEIDNLGVGEYCATITPENGCVIYECFIVGFEAAPLVIEAVNAQDLTCNGDESGALTVSFFGGYAPYTVEVNGETITTSETTVTITGLAGGTYTATITDDQGEVITTPEQTINEPEPLTLSVVNVRHDTEESGCSGQISLQPAGGVPGYQVMWNTPSQGPTIFNLCDGNYVPTVIDENGCETTFDPIEVNTFELEAAVSSADCPDSPDGTIDLSIAGGEPAYTITWRNAQNQIISTEEDLGDVAPGLYTVTVMETSGNVLTRTFQVGAVSDLALEVEVISSYNGFDISCANAEDAVIAATGLNSDGNYAYEWSRDGMLVGTDPMLSNAGGGAYQISVIDGLGCVVTETVTVVAPPAIEIDGVAQQVSCPGDRDGEIVVTASGGTANSTFLYQWNTGTVGPQLTALPGGEYVVTATDANNCSAQATFEIVEPSPIQVTVATEPAEEGCNGTARAIVVGGTPPYNFTWNAPTGSPFEDFLTDLCPGEYFVQVTDSQGCTPEVESASSKVLDRRFDCIETKKVITPDGDGLNEAFIITCSEEFNDNHLEIYNRWGQMVFEAENYDCGVLNDPSMSCWRGLDKDGSELPEGPYFFVFNYTGPEGELIQVKGSITLLRD